MKSPALILGRRIFEKWQNQDIWRYVPRLMCSSTKGIESIMKRMMTTTKVVQLFIKRDLSLILAWKHVREKTIQLLVVKKLAHDVDFSNGNEPRLRSV